MRIVYLILPSFFDKMKKPNNIIWYIHTSLFICLHPIPYSNRYVNEEYFLHVPQLYIQMNSPVFKFKAIIWFNIVVCEFRIVYRIHVKTIIMKCLFEYVYMFKTWRELIKNNVLGSYICVLTWWEFFGY